MATQVSGKTSIIVILFLVVPLIAAIVHDQLSGPDLPPIKSRPTPVRSSIRDGIAEIGDIITIRPTAQGKWIPVSATLEVQKSVRKALRAQDDDGLDDLIRVGLLMLIREPTQARVLDRSVLTHSAQVRILEGRYGGRSGWVPLDFIR